MTQQKKNNKITPIIGVLILVLAFVLFIKIIIPLVLMIFSMFYGLILMLDLIDTNFKFLGFCFFLVIYWKIFEALSLGLYSLGKYGWKLVMEGMK